MSKVAIPEQLGGPTGILPTGMGGTGNPYGYAGGTVVPLRNDSDAAIPIGRAVRPRMRNEDNPGVTLADEVDDIRALGIAAGRYRTTGVLFGEFQAAEIAANELCAIVVAGLVQGRFSIDAVQGEYVYNLTGGGELYSSPMLRPGHLGRVLEDVAAGDLGLVFVGGDALGRQREAYVSRYEPAPHDAFRYQLTDASAGTDMAEAVDGDPTTSWNAGSGTVPQNLDIDLSRTQAIREVRVRWGTQYGTAYTIESSPDATTWTVRATITANTRKDRASDLGAIIEARYWRLKYTAISGGTPAVVAFEGYPSATGLNHSSLDNMRFAIPVLIGNRSTVPATGYKGEIEVPVPCVFEGWRMVSDQTCTAVVDIWKDTYANFPPTVADTITAAAKPTLTAARKAENSALAGWTDECAAGDWLAFNLDSDDAATQLRLSLLMRRI